MDLDRTPRYTIHEDTHRRNCNGSEKHGLDLCSTFEELGSRGIPALADDVQASSQHRQCRCCGIILVLARGKSVCLIPTMPQHMADGPLQQMTAHREALARVVARHRLNQAPMLVEVLNPIAFHHQAEALLVKRRASLRFMRALLDRLVLRQGVVDSRWLNSDGHLPRQGANHERNAAAQRVPCEDDLAPGSGDLTHMLQDLTIVPLLITDSKGCIHPVHAANQKSSRLPGPSSG
mmetsp:Transcript_87074/g.219229  ORF Transcript_87074/g.219229 Transcript_87074/m.219229 type:complete len:235 (+) Transcript_87074:256-960(+)